MMELVLIFYVLAGGCLAAYVAWRGDLDQFRPHWKLIFPIIILLWPVLFKWSVEIESGETDREGDQQ